VWGGLSESDRDDIIRGHDRTLRVAGAQPRVRGLST
jgi:hypothetical protein